MNETNLIEILAKRDEAIEQRFAAQQSRLDVYESKLDELNGYLRGVVQSNEKLISLFTKSFYVLAFIAVVSVGAVIFGAIGREGMHAVRDFLPTPNHVYLMTPPDNHELIRFQRHDKQPA